MYDELEKIGEEVDMASVCVPSCPGIWLGWQNGNMRNHNSVSEWLVQNLNGPIPKQKSRL
jgi:hypothetical protein